MTRPEDVALVELTDHLQPRLGHRIRELVDADSRAARLLDVEAELQRATDLAHECRRQLRYRERDVDRLTSRVSELEAAR